MERPGRSDHIIVYLNNSTMKKSRAFIFNVVFQVAIALLALDLQFHPLLLRSQCVTGHVSSEQLGEGDVVDCLACHSFSSRDVGDQFIGYLTVLVPLNDVSNGLNARLPFDSAQLKKSPLREQFLFNAQVLSESGCSEYSCSALHVLQDFELRSKTSINLLNQYNIDHENQVFFTQSNNPLASLSFPLGFSSQPAVAYTSNSISKEDLSSLIIRTRHLVNDKVEGDRQPAILIHELQTGILARFILILVLLLQANRILMLLTHFASWIRVLLFFILASGFVSSHAAALSSALAIYLVIAKLHNSNRYGILTAFLFLAISLSNLSGSFPLSIPAAFVIVYSVVVSVVEMRERFGLLELATLGGVIVTTCYMWTLNWHFFVFLAPLLMLGALLSVKEEKEGSKNSKYDLIHFNDDEEDVLTKIERELR